MRAALSPSLPPSLSLARMINNALMDSPALLFWLLILCILMQSYARSSSRVSAPWSFALNASDNLCTDLSGNATRLCFVSSGSQPQAAPSFTLSLLISPLSFDYLNPQPIWNANRHRPVSDGATVKLGLDGNLVLSDSDGTLIWSSNTLHKGVSGIQIEPSYQVAEFYFGCLALFNSSNGTVWSSFDSPTDTFMENQALAPGQKLVSNLSSSDPSEGPYSLVLEPGGFALYFDTGLGQLLPYWTWGVYRLNDLYSVSHTCERPFGAIFEDYRIIFYPEAEDSNATSSQLCGIIGSKDVSVDYFNLDEVISSASSSIDLSFVRLETDGGLRSYSWAGNGWLLEYDPLADQCLLPNKCGPYSICTWPSVCSCPQNVTLEGHGFSEGLNGIGCVPTSPLSLPPSCNMSNSSSSIVFAEQAGVEYVSSQYLAPNLPSVALSKCREACLENCSCKAFFYYNETRSCYFALHQLWTMRKTNNQSHVAFIKVVNTPPSSSRQKIIAVSVAVPSGVLAVSVIAAILGLKRKRRILADDEARLRGEEQDLDDVHFTRFTYKALEDATSGFTSRKLGRGGAGDVFEGQLPGRGMVAIKRLKDGDVNSFRAEVETLGRVNHVNLVRLEGFCAEESHRLLVYEYISNGALSNWIFNSNKVFPWSARIRVAQDAADCFAYLHEKCREHILHLDIKPQNILLDEQMRAKVSDFGLAKLLRRSGDVQRPEIILPGAGGTYGYIAPELFARNHVATAKADVYSFGIVLWELFSGRRVVERQQDSYSFGPLTVFPKVKAEAWDEVVAPSVYKDVEQSERGLLEVKKVMRLAYWCIQKDLGTRPDMRWVSEHLQSEREVPMPPYSPTFAPDLVVPKSKMDASTMIPQAESLSFPR